MLSGHESAFLGAEYLEYAFRGVGKICRQVLDPVEGIQFGQLTQQAFPQRRHVMYFLHLVFVFKLDNVWHHTWVCVDFVEVAGVGQSVEQPCFAAILVAQNQYAFLLHTVAANN